MFVLLCYQCARKLGDALMCVARAFLGLSLVFGARSVAASRVTLPCERARGLSSLWRGVWYVICSFLLMLHVKSVLHEPG